MLLSSCYFKDPLSIEYLNGIVSPDIVSKLIKYFVVNSYNLNVNKFPSTR